ncbi:Rieske (2Fe-2S) protein [Corynebacterium kozikiae]|uniref:Rieske (2Fe-2S) protein n=1 Tax=Corynebacterium kozikiae TaxID=2968469 RepID=UPI00211BFB97|nr:Rieske 2Fe-2S domain-containing protein [Corynebacterium sp. 76QC2CO]MCQ9343770.1 Rieske 2Fe-2S domain-containing protein [Corynebacterium sp. 76QC2CO]
MTCSRRMFLLGTASTFAGALLAACGKEQIDVAVQDVPVGSAVIVGEYIVAQPTAGQYVAYSTLCPHQNGTITEVRGDEVTCLKHNSTFSIVDGSPIEGPSRAPMKPVDIAVEDGTATVG